jgi:hypothetical protein
MPNKLEALSSNPSTAKITDIKLEFNLYLEY